MTAVAEFCVGQLCTWTFSHRGGYGYTFKIPVMVWKVGAVRVQVEAPLERGGTKLVWVKPENLTARPQPTRS